MLDKKICFKNISLVETKIVFIEIFWIVQTFAPPSGKNNTQKFVLIICHYIVASIWQNQACIAVANTTDSIVDLTVKILSTGPFTCFNV